MVIRIAAIGNTKLTEKRPLLGTLAAILSLSFLALLVFVVQSYRYNRDLQASAIRERRGATEAKTRLEITRRLLHASQIHRVFQMVENGLFVEAQEILESSRPRAGEEDLRSFDWYYVHKGHVNVLAFSPDGNMLFSGGGIPGSPGEGKLWRAARREDGAKKGK